MSTQVVYQTNADWHASSEALFGNPLVRTFSETDKGLLSFGFVGSPTIFMLASTGKLQVKWKDLAEKQTLFKLVKELLKAKPNEKLVIKPLKQQTWIDYPQSDEFKLYWCGEETKFVVKKPLNGLPKSRSEMEREKRIAESQAEFFQVKKAVDELRREFGFLREPTFNEVALKSGILNTQKLRLDLVLCGWKEESEETVKRTAEHALNLAAWLTYREKSEQTLPLKVLCKKFIDSAYLDTIRKAQIIIKECPECVPQVESDQLKWPEGTKAI